MSMRQQIYINTLNEFIRAHFQSHLNGDRHTKLDLEAVCKDCMRIANHAAGFYDQQVSKETKEFAK